MQASIQMSPVSTRSLWTGRILSGIGVLFMVMDGVMHIAKPEPVVEAMTKLGYPLQVSPVIGILELILVILYVLPRTAVLGSVLLTGYLGGAVATHVRVGSDPFSHIFPIIIGALLWGGLLLRDERLRSVFPLRS